MRAQLTALAALVAAVSAQTQNYTSSLDMTIDPNSVDSGDRVSWCDAQYNTCNALCENDTNKNDCFDSTLKFDCTCTSNNSAPGLQFYTQTIPTFICQKVYEQCLASTGGIQKATDACIKDIQDLCGKVNPPSANNGTSGDDTTTTTTTGAASSATDAKKEPVSSSTSGGFAAPTMAPAGKGAAAAVAIGMLAYLI